MMPLFSRRAGIRNAGLRRIVLLTMCSLAPIALMASCSPNKDGKKSIAITQIVEHPSLNAIRDGIQEELIQSGYEPGKTLNWSWESAQGSPSTAAQIAKKIAGEAPDAIVAISTPSAQTLIAAAPKLPIVFSGVTDPLGAKLVPNLQTPGGQVTGVSDRVPLGKHLDLMRQLTPKVKRIGVLYNSGEANSVSQVTQLKAEAQKQSLTIVEVTVTNSSEVATAAKSLVGKVDSIYVPTDNTIVSALDAVLQVGIANQIPVYAGDTDSVDRGAVATLGFNYKEMGRQTGKIVTRILKGEKPGSIAIETPTQLDLVINAKSAKQMGVTVPATLKQSAKKVIE